ncbi:MAG: alpha/beta hydrolase [Desulfopila sp.]|jgi:hypothetical protein|nr:alpha/beta hydrolase [Desulfopila sp.]
MKILKAAGCFLLIVFLLACAGCGQKRVYLMPAPVAIQPDSNFFKPTESDNTGNRLLTLYATNRIPFNMTETTQSYSIFPSDDLRMGYCIHSVGDEDMSWMELYEMSLRKTRQKDLRINLEFNREIVQFDEEQDIKELLPGQKEFFKTINAILERKADKDITVYVHGANSNFYRATAQGAQYFHFTGHNSIVINFSWPSAENIFKYKVDVLHARKTVPAFARLIEILALHTHAKNIDIIAYSAGAQVAAPALLLLRDQQLVAEPEEIRERLRIGEVYFAAPDIDMESFAFRYHRFKDIVKRTTISINVNDSTLRYSSLASGKARLGRPLGGEISIAEETIFSNASATESLNIIDIQGSTALEAGKSHSFWYSHPWVSTDLLMLMLFNLPPDQRGLTRHTVENDLVIYRFPENYEEKIEEQIKMMEAQAYLKSR